VRAGWRGRGASRENNPRRTVERVYLTTTQRATRRGRSTVVHGSPHRPAAAVLHQLNVVGAACRPLHSGASRSRAQIDRTRSFFYDHNRTRPHTPLILSLFSLDLTVALSLFLSLLPLSLLFSLDFTLALSTLPSRSHSQLSLLFSF